MKIIAITITGLLTKVLDVQEDAKTGSAWALLCHPDVHIKKVVGIPINQKELLANMVLALQVVAWKLLEDRVLSKLKI